MYTYQSRVHGSISPSHACCFWLSPIFWTAASNWSSYFICFFLMHLEYCCRWICCGKGKAAKLCGPEFSWLQGTYFYELNKWICVYLDVVNLKGKVRHSFTLTWKLGGASFYCCSINPNIYVALLPFLALVNKQLMSSLLWVQLKPYVSQCPIGVQTTEAADAGK